MANRKISELGALTAPAADDLLAVVDVSEGSNSNKNKKITYGELFKSVIDGTETAPAIAFDSAGTTGLYRSAANELSIATNGGKAITIEANNKTTIFGDLVVTGGTTTVSSTTITVADKNLELATGNTSDAGATGGGLTLKAATDKTWNWVDSTDSWTSNQNIDLVSGMSYKIQANQVLTATTLGSGVVNSSLTSVGTLGSLAVTNAITAGSLDISGGADIDGTMEADAYTVNGTALNVFIQDTVGAMVSGNTETNISVSYDSTNNNLDFEIDTYPAASISGTTLASNVVTSSLTSVGTLGSLNVTNAVTAGSLDISGGADIDGTLEADAITVDGKGLNEFIADTVGAMVSSNTENNISVTYQDSDNTLDFDIGTLNQNTTGNANTATALQTARTIGGVSFNGTANINLPGVNQQGDQNTTGSAATLTTARMIGGVSFDGSANINLPGVNAVGSQNTSGTAAGLSGTPNITVGVVTAGSLDISGGADIDGTLEADAYTVNGTALNVFIQDTVGAMVSNNTETNIAVTYDSTNNNLDFVIGTLNQDTTGNAATATALETTRQLGGVDFDGTQNINLPGVNAQGSQNTTGTSAGLSGTPNITVNAVVAASLDISGDADIDGTLETDALTIGGISLSETIADTVGAMVSSNTESGISVTYDDTDNTLDFTVGTLNQNTTGSAATLTTARDIGGVSFNGSANINLPGVNAAGNQNTSGNAASATALATARAINGVDFDGTAPITVTAAAGTLTGNTLSSGVTASSLTSVGTLTGLTVSGDISMTGTGAIDIPSGTTAQRPGSPTTGHFRYNTTDAQFEGFTSTGWGAIAGGGGAANFTYLALRNAANNGSAVFDGSQDEFTLVSSGTTTAISPSAANVLLTSVGGVIQQPNEGTNNSGITGFCIDGSTIKFGANLSAAPDFIIHQVGAGVGTPSDNTVDLAHLAHKTQGDILYYGSGGAPGLMGAGTSGQFLRTNGSGADPSWETITAYTHPNHSGEVTSSGDGATTIASNVVDEDNLKISNSGSNGQFLQKQSGNTGGLTWATVDLSSKLNTAGGSLTGDLTLSTSVPTIIFNDTDNENDFNIQNINGTFAIGDIDAGAARLEIDSNGVATFRKNLNALEGLDVTGNITVSGTVDGVDIGTRNTLFGGLTSSSGVLTNGVIATTQSASDNSTKVATTAYVETAVSNLVDSAPGTLNTLNELAAALGDDASFSTTITNSIATKAVLTGSTNNQITTVTGANAIQGEANLVFDGSGDFTVLGGEGLSANLYLKADQGDDNGDGWRIGSNQDDNDLTFANNTSGSFVDKLTLLKTGKFGIGTSPATTLHIKGSNEILRLETTATTGNGFIQFNDADENKAFIGMSSASDNRFDIWNVKNSFVRIGTNDTERLRIDSSGDVRIMTANAMLKWTASSGNDPFIRSIGSGQQSLEFNTGGGERVRIASDGMVGIGHNNPNTLLHLNSSTDQQIKLAGASNPYICLQEGGTDKGYLQWHSDGYLKFKNQEDASSIRIKDTIDFSTDDSTWHTVWHAGNDGSGSGLDADTVDGVQASNIWQKSGSWTGDLSSNGFTREIGLAMTGGSEFVILSKNGQGHVLVDGDFHAYEAGGFWSSQNSVYGNIVGFKADSTTSAKWKGHLKPDANNTYDLGSSADRWKDLYVMDLQLSNKGKTNDVDGTWGDWTLQEGETDVFMINNRTGKRYKMALQEVS